MNASISIQLVLSDVADADGMKRALYWCPFEISRITIPVIPSARDRSAPPPLRVLETLAAAAAERASSPPLTWSRWMDELAPKNAVAADPAAAAKLVRAELERELARHAEETRARFLRPSEELPVTGLCST